jgi:hypothetical protein
MLVLEENRLEHAPKALHRSLRAHIDYLRKQIKQSDSDLDREVRDSALWDQYELLSSVPGVGPVLIVALLSEEVARASSDRPPPGQRWSAPSYGS